MPVVDTLLTLLFAPRCAACDRPLATPSAGPVCADCWGRIIPLGPRTCRRCGDRLDLSPAMPHGLEADCLRCRHRPPLIAHAAAAAPYEPTLRRVIHAFKYDGRRSLATPLARLLVARGGHLLDGAACLVPVPLHPVRRLTRGFNQADDLARQVSRLLGGPPVVRALARCRRTGPQEGLTIEGRRRNVTGAFRLSRQLSGARAHDARASCLTGRVVVLVDDVRTTGATLDQCAAVLLEAGASEVRALTVALARRIWLPGAASEADDAGCDY